MSDFSAVLWKEWRELIRQRGNWRGFLLGLLAPVILFGLLLPMRIGQEWLTSPASLTAWFYMPIAIVMTMMADSIAGERERHTLETLLATRLSDRAILLGKIGSAVLYALLLALVIVGVGLLTANLIEPNKGWRFYHPVLFMIGLVGGLLLSILGAAVGALISIRSKTVRQAAQTISYFMLSVFFLPIIALELMPAGILQGLGDLISPFIRNGAAIGCAAVVMLIVTDFLFVLLAISRFRRTRLMLE